MSRSAGRRAQGFRAAFTLIELMIVVAIIAIIAAIAIPNLLRARLQSNEASAVENLRTISTAQISYHTAKGIYGTFEELATADPESGFLVKTWAQDVIKGGYRFAMDAVTDGDFVCYADPRVEGKSGNRFFRVDASGVIRYALGARPDETANPID